MLQVKSKPDLFVMTKDQSLYVTLEKVQIEASIRSLQMADVRIAQIFRNNTETFIDAVYHFPPEQQETTYAITIHTDDRADDQTNISKEDKALIDVGPIAPSKECLITLVYTTQLNSINASTVELIIPSFLVSVRDRNTDTIQFSCNAQLMDDLLKQQRPIVQVQCSQENTYLITFLEENIHCLSSVNRTTMNTVGQPFDYYCVLDFEAVCHQVDPRLTQPSPNDTWEIIEFPICLLEVFRSLVSLKTWLIILLHLIPSRWMF